MNLLKLAIFCSWLVIVMAQAQFPHAYLSYQHMLAQGMPFAMSIGVSISQTKHLDNTAHPRVMRSQLQKVAQKQKNPRAWLDHADRHAYVMRSLPSYVCTQCQKIIDPSGLLASSSMSELKKLFDDIACYTHAQNLSIHRCVYCQGLVSELEQAYPKWDWQHDAAYINQIEYFNFGRQRGCQQGLPTCRISLEMCEVLEKDSTNFDHTQIMNQSNFLKKLGNPFVFFHHYVNPAQIPYLFEHKRDIDLFADYCGHMIAANPQLTYVCPISQPTAFYFRVTRGTLPPFECNIHSTEYFDNIMHAQEAAYKKMKAINPALKVFVSHQWKPFKPYHSAYDPRYLLEYLICSIADRIYNGSFIYQMKKHPNSFDGIALSLYPSLYFNLFTPIGQNCNGLIDEIAALESIIAIHTAFPGKEIIIAETGCSTLDSEIKKQFIDMTLSVCKQARDRGIPVTGVYFWGQTNDPDYYTEWDFLSGTTHFGPFDSFDVNNPCASINASGLYVQEILDRCCSTSL